MKLEDVKIMLDKISIAAICDDEAAHGLEDDLFYRFVEAIANDEFKTKDEITEIAKEVNKVRSIEFGRWRS